MKKILSVLALLGSSAAHADEGGVSFWLPGQYGSFAAIAPSPGFSLPLVTYFFSGGSDKALKRGNLLSAELEGKFLAQFIVPSWAPTDKIFGAQANFSIAVVPAHSKVSADVTIGPFTGQRSDSVTGFGDLYPTAQLFWADGVNNWMAYVTGNIPVGSYSPDRLANLGIGHAAIDFGGAYTYLNPQSGREFSATAGVTFNFVNPDTQYTNGIAGHLDLGFAQFLSEKAFIGAAGYAYQQLSADKGQLSVQSETKSRVFGVGPQAGYNFMAGSTPIYTNIRGYVEFGAQRRLQGGSIFFTVNVPISQLRAAKSNSVSP